MYIVCKCTDSLDFVLHIRMLLVSQWFMTIANGTACMVFVPKKMYMHVYMHVCLREAQINIFSTHNLPEASCYSSLLDCH